MQDLAPADQAVQAAHAALDFAAEHPGIFGSWQRDSNTLVLLSVRDEVELYELAYNLSLHGHKITVFREPDLDWRVTAIAAAPSAGRLLRNLPLALSDGEGVNQDGTSS